MLFALSSTRALEQEGAEAAHGKVQVRHARSLTRDFRTVSDDVESPGGGVFENPFSKFIPWVAG